MSGNQKTICAAGCVQVMQWFGKHGAAVCALDIAIRSQHPQPSWAGGAAGLLALTPQLQRLSIRDKCGFLFGDDVMYFSRTLLSSSLRKSMIPDSLPELTALKSLTLNIDICGPAFPLTQQLTAMSRLTQLSLAGSNVARFDRDGSRMRIGVNVPVPQLSSVRHLTLGGQLDPDLKTLSKFCKLETLHLKSFFPNPASFLSPSHCQHLCRIVLEKTFPVPGLSGWISLFEALLELPALQDLQVYSDNLNKLTDNYWAFHPGLEVLNDNFLSCPTRMTYISQLISLAQEIGRLYQLPDGVHLKHVCIVDLSRVQGMGN